MISPVSISLMLVLRSSHSTHINSTLSFSFFTFARNLPTSSLLTISCIWDSSRLNSCNRIPIVYLHWSRRVWVTSTSLSKSFFLNFFYSWFRFYESSCTKVRIVPKAIPFAILSLTSLNLTMSFLMVLVPITASLFKQHTVINVVMNESLLIFGFDPS